MSLNNNGSALDKAASRIKRLTPSPIREILKVIDKPGMISFAGGLPASDSFPDISIGEIDPAQLQYGATEGDLELRKYIAQDLRDRSMVVDVEQILILSGSQQGIDLVAKLFIEQGTRVAVESPSYLAALQVFSLFGAKYLSFTPESLSQLESESDIALTYAVPTFQNPTGHCYTDTQRQSLAAACDATGCVLFEDDPYRELCFDTCERQPVCSRIESTQWIYQSSFSKVLAPGLRLGYLVCSPELYPALVWLKQAADLHSNRLSQHIVLSQLKRSDAAARMKSINALYRHRRDTFEQSLQKHFADLATWQVPHGGLFFWLNLKTRQSIDTGELLSKALQHNVAFMPGEPFFPDASCNASCLRLNFSHATESQADKGLALLSQLIREML
ncbi:GntR family transcriptional regulator [Chromatiales bacterium (ex Bugula neritina AB1)]|nr:GntR family transcriptional regulator [Chromatiales bacterium (ex Bugula neritina AB1)]